MITQASGAANPPVYELPPPGSRRWFISRASVGPVPAVPKCVRLTSQRMTTASTTNRLTTILGMVFVSPGKARELD